MKTGIESKPKSAAGARDVLDRDHSVSEKANVRPVGVLRPVLAETGLTLVLMFTVVTAIRGALGPQSPTDEQPIWVKLTLIGVIVGVTLVLLIRSPWGRLSGAHMNPAITVGFWLLRLLPRRLVLPYAAAQTLGAFAGVGLARLLWGPDVAKVHFGAAAADPNWGDQAIFISEAAVPFIVILLVAHSWTARFLPIVLGGISAVAIAALGPLSGGSINPVRQLAPAVLGGAMDHLWIYLTAPIVGAATAPLVLRAHAAWRTAMRRRNH